MKNGNKKKIIVLCSMLVLLVATGFLNFYLNGKLGDNSDMGGDGGIVTTTYFGTFRSDREAQRQEIFTYLDSIVASEASSEEAKAAAESQKLELCEKIEQELTLENLIKASGFEDAVITMSTGNLNVVVKADNELDNSQIAQILSIITRETTYTPSQVVIVPYN